MALPLLGLLAAGLFSSGALTYGADMIDKARRSRRSGARNQGLLSAQQGYGALPTEREKIGPVMPGQQPAMVPDQPGSGFLGTLSESNPMAAQQLNQQVGLLANPVESVRDAAQTNINSLMQRDYAPDVQKPDAFTNKLVQMGYQQGTPEYTAAARELAMKSGTTVNVGGPAFKTPAGFMLDPANPTRVIKIPGTQYTGEQTTAANYANRMTRGEDIFSTLESEGVDFADLKQNLAADVPGGNYLLDPGFQQYRAAADDWIRAKLRKESGAVIAEEEMQKEYETYFPQPGDSPVVQRQKKQARIEATKGMAAQSQGAFSSLFPKDEPKVIDWGDLPSGR